MDKEKLYEGRLKQHKVIPKHVNMANYPRDSTEVKKYAVINS